MNKKNILIVGGTGFIGYHLAKKAIQKKLIVTSISTKPAKKIRYLKYPNAINQKILAKEYECTTIEIMQHCSSQNSRKD